MITSRGRTITGSVATLALVFGAITALPAAASTTHTVCPPDSDPACDFTSIQAAMDAAPAGDTILVAPGTYSAAVTVSKDVDIVGAGSSGDSITQINGLVTVSASGASTANPLVISGVRITNSAGNGVGISNGVSNVTLNSVTLTGSSAAGLQIFGGANTNSGLVLQDVDILANTGTGISMQNSTRIDGFGIYDSEISNNGNVGLSYNSSGTAISLTNLVLEDTVFSNNSAAVSQTNNTGSGDISLFQFNGNVRMTRVSVSAPNDANLSQYAVQIAGRRTSPTTAGTVVLEDLSISGYYQRMGASAGIGGQGLVIADYTDVSGFSMSGVSVDTNQGHALYTWGLSTTLDLGDTSLRAQRLGDATIVVGSSGFNNAKTVIDASDASIGGVGYAAIATSTATSAQLATMADSIADAVDYGSSPAALTGHVYLRPNTIFVTANSYIPGITSAPSIQRAIDTAVAGDTVQAAAGTYAENLTISKNLSLIGPNSTVAALPEAGWVREDEAVIGATSNGSPRVTISGTPTVTISGFKFVGPTAGVATAATGITASGDSSATVTNNWFDTLANEVAGYVVAGGADIYPQGGSGTGNWVISGNRHDGPAVGGDTTTAPYSFSAINAWNLNSVTIHGNRIEGYGFAGVQLEGTKQGNITSNFIKDVGANGIQVANGATGPVVVRGNTIDNASAYYSTLAPSPGADPYFPADQIDPDYCWAGIRIWNTSAAGAVEITNNLLKNTPGRCGAIGFTGTTNQAISKIENNSIDGSNIDGISDGGRFFIESYAVSNNVATITTYGATSSYAVGDDVTITGLGFPFNGTHVLTAASYNTSTWRSSVSFALTTADVAQTFVNLATSTAVMVPEAFPGTPIPAESNWWGSADGPSAAGNSKNSLGVAASVEPWISSYVSGTPAAGYISAVGFWPTSIVYSQSVSITTVLPLDGQRNPATAPGTSFSVSSAGGESGNPIVLTSLTPLVCSIASNTVTTIRAGLCTIRGTQAGTSFYAAAQTDYSVNVVAPARPPLFTSTTRTADGFTFVISNFSDLWTWGVSTSTGSVNRSGNLVTVSGLDPLTSATVTVTTTRDFYASGSNSLTSSSLPSAIGAALNPSFGTAVATTDGFQLPITNYNGFWTWSVTASNPSASASISGSGVVTVTGLSSGEASTVTVTTARTNYTSGSATSGSISSLQAALTPTFGTVTVTSDGFTLPIVNFDPAFTWTVDLPLGGAGVAATQPTEGNEQIVVTGLTPGQLALVVVNTTRTGYQSGIATYSGSAEQAGRVPLFSRSTSRTADGFVVPIRNYTNFFTWTPVLNVDPTLAPEAAAIIMLGRVVVTGLPANVPANVTVTTSRFGYTTESATTVTLQSTGIAPMKRQLKTRTIRIFAK